MASACDVAAYILEKLGPVSHMKLQKLVFYSQAWSLVWDEKPLFTDRIEAWANGPVVPSVYQLLRGKFTVTVADLAPVSPEAISPEQRETIDRVLNFYGDKNPQWLSDLTHMERPWLAARDGLPPGARSDALITHASMAEYYGGL